MTENVRLSPEDLDRPQLTKSVLGSLGLYEEMTPIAASYDSF